MSDVCNLPIGLKRLIKAGRKSEQEKISVLEY